MNECPSDVERSAKYYFGFCCAMIGSVADWEEQNEVEECIP